MATFSIGDSHCDYCFNGIPGLQVRWLGPRTMYRVGRDGLLFLNLRTLGLKDGDIAILSFGEIDVRTHIGRIRDERKHNENDLIELLVARYMMVAVQNRNLFSDLKLIISSVVPPSDKLFREDKTLPFYGTLSDRITITQTLNKKLSYYCSVLGFGFVDVYTPFADEDGSLPVDKRADLVHLDRRFVKIVQTELERSLGYPISPPEKDPDQAPIPDQNHQPPFLAMSINELFVHDKNYVKLEDVKVETTNWIVTWKNRAIFPWVGTHIESIEGRKFTNCFNFSRDEQVRIIGWEKSRRIKLASGFLVGGDPNYYHFLVDWLANALYAETDSELGAIPLLVSARFPWQSEIISCYNLTAGSVLQFKENMILEIDELFVPKKSFDVNGQLNEKTYFSWVKDKTKTVKSRYNYDKIYVSRNSSRCRRLENETSLMDVISPLGFVKIDIEELAIRDQIGLFRNAKIIIGPTGAAFANVIYCSPGSQLVEFMPGKTWRPNHIKDLCGAAGVQYNRIICDGEFSSLYFTAEISALLAILTKLGIN